MPISRLAGLVSRTRLHARPLSIPRRSAQLVLPARTLPTLPRFASTMSAQKIDGNAIAKYVDMIVLGQR